MVKTLYKTIDDKTFNTLEEAEAHEDKWTYRTIKLSGHSDDVIYVETPNTRDEIYESDNIILETQDGPLKIHPIYDGCWTFAIGLVNEGQQFPKIDFHYSLEHEYSLALNIEVDNGSVLKVIGQDGDIKYF